jgi:exonuclease III
MDMVNIYRVFRPTTRQYTFFSATHGTFSKTDHILGHKRSLNKFKKIKIIPCMISDHNSIKLDLSNKRNHRKYSIQWVTKKIREEIKMS